MSVDSLCQILASSRLCSDPKIIENTLYMYGQNFCMLKDQNGRSVVKAVTDLEVEYNQRPYIPSCKVFGIILF